VIHCLDCRVPLTPPDMVYHIIRRHPARARAVLRTIRAHIASNAALARRGRRGA
jgi:plasmid stabilization system protein ParE